jgi:ubiquinone/menaquinone biosynthesis C-methylase UbiE
MIPNQQQSEAWNGAESMHYVDQADRYDRQLAPVTDALIARAGIERGHRVLDVGSGSGVTTLEAARVASHVLGVDISEPLTRVARDRARSAQPATPRSWLPTLRRTSSTWPLSMS